MDAPKRNKDTTAVGMPCGAGQERNETLSIWDIERQNADRAERLSRAHKQSSRIACVRKDAAHRHSVRCSICDGCILKQLVDDLVAFSSCGTSSFFRRLHPSRRPTARQCQTEELTTASHDME
jgi:hypothetical protein